MNHLEEAKDILKDIPTVYVESGRIAAETQRAIAYALIALIERLDKIADYDAGAVGVALVANLEK